MEPMNFFAHVTADGAELLGPIQTPEQLRTTTAAVLGLPEDKVTVGMTRQGGGFGRRLYGHFGVEAAVISKHVNAPVKLVYTREDDMTQGTYRPAYKVKYQAAIDKNNNLLGIKIRGAGIHESPVFAHRFPAGAVDHYLVENHALDSNISTGAWRAPRSNFMAIAEQSFLDEVAEAVGKDPIDFRLELLDRAATNPVGERNDYDAARYAGVLKLVKEKSGWGEKKDGVHRGVSAYFCHNSYVAQVMDVVIKNSKPVVQKVWCAVDCGIVVNPEGAKNQLEGGIVDGIGHTLYSEMTFKDGKPDQTNFHNYRLIRNSEAPLEVECFFVDNGIDPTGLGEPGLPPAGAALANALYAATGKRLTTQPFAKSELAITPM
jgi:isoquinoline 1-oxidoreductase beta subunit